MLDKNDWEFRIKNGAIYGGNESLLRSYIEESISTPFDLSADVMLRGELIVLDKEVHILVMTLHHIASDGWSKSIIVRELVEFYAAYVEGRPATLPPLPVQYADYALWQREYLWPEMLERKLTYWKEKLRDVTVLELPTDYPRPLVQSTRGAVLGFVVDKDLSDQVQQLSQRRGATLFMTLLAAFKVLLHRYSGQRDISVGSAIAGRQQQEVEDLVGFFINTLVLRSQVDGSMSFAELLEQVKRTTLEAYEHQDAPFEKVVGGRDEGSAILGRNPLVQVMFTLQNTPKVPTLRLGEITLYPEEFAHTTAQFDLNFVVIEHSAGLGIGVEYRSDLYRKVTIERMGQHFVRLLEGIVEEPGRAVSTLKMLNSKERHQLFGEFNATAVDYPRDRTIVDLFEEQVLRTPEAVAVVFGEERLTYRELDEQFEPTELIPAGKGGSNAMVAG